jgi:hypothetical protein
MNHSSKESVGVTGSLSGDSVLPLAQFARDVRVVRVAVYPARSAPFLSTCMCFLVPEFPETNPCRTSRRTRRESETRGRETTKVLARDVRLFEGDAAERIRFTCRVAMRSNK